MRLSIKTVFLCISLVLGILSFLISLLMIGVGVDALSNPETLQFFILRPFGTAKEIHWTFHSAGDIYIFTTCTLILSLISISLLYLTYRKRPPSDVGVNDGVNVGVNVGVKILD